MNQPGPESLARQAANIVSPLDRAAFLDRECGGDAALRQTVESLLGAGAGGVNIAQAETVADAPEVHEAFNVPVGAPGEKVGRYRLLRKIGEGGCGTVFLAEQEEPVRRQVALKVIKLGMDTRHVVARFEAERQALAMMDHPHIARVLDAGATEAGRPFFVMEWVRGVSITKFCDENGLEPGARITLFIQVCQAIQHAHQKGVIHRDIKPSNILVELHDGVPVPKVIDFGIAKAMDESLTGETRHTPQQAFVGTPAYASPEQAATGGLDVDTRTDVYSLGAVLYELLTGCQPFDREKLMAGGILGVCRIICETEPLRPSTRLRGLSHAERAVIAQARHVGPERLPGLVRGDLDWIVMKCLEKERARRYETANGLAADLRRYLHNEPVAARPPSTGYVLQKLMHKHRLVFAAGSAVAASLVIGLAASTWLYFQERAAKLEQERLQREANASARKAGTNAERARTEAAKSRQVSLFMKEMIESVGPVAMASESTMWRQIVDKAAERIGQQRLDPSVEWEIRTTLGEVYFSLGQKREAVDMQLEALRLARQNTGLGPVRIVDSLVSLGWMLNQSGQPVAADPLLREALVLAGQHFPTNDSKHIWIKGRLGWNLMDLGRLDEAEPLCREALDKAREHWNGTGEWRAELPGSLASYATGLAYVMQLRGRTAQAEELFREAADAARRDKGENHPDNAGWIKNLASFLRSIGRGDEAGDLYRKAWELDKAHAPNHPRQIGAAGNLALLLRESGDDAEADRIISRLIATAKSLPEADRLSWANNLAAVGVNGAMFGHWSDAAQLLRAAKESGSDNERGPVLRMAVAWRLKDTAATREAFSDFLARLNKGGQRALALDLATALTLWPPADSDAAAMRRVADLARDPIGASEWNPVAQALVSYRMSQFETATELARKVAAGADAGPRVAAHLIMAMCRQRSNQPGPARASLAAGREAHYAWASGEPALQNRRWLDLVIAEALLLETRSVVEGVPAARAP